jgi:hypothetical protein
MDSEPDWPGTNRSPILGGVQLFPPQYPPQALLAGLYDRNLKLDGGSEIKTCAGYS